MEGKGTAPVLRVDEVAEEVRALRSRVDDLTL